MGSTISSHASPKTEHMRCRSTSQVPACFRDVTCPYSKAETACGSYGATNYAFLGPENGEVVVCFHGLNGSRLLFKETAAYLSIAGFRVLNFDLYGHGLSNAPHVDLCPCEGVCGKSCCSWAGGPRGRYDLYFFVEQADELLCSLGLESEPVNLLGFSLGGAVAAAFAQRYPSRVRRLMMISPSGCIPRTPRAYYLLKALWCCLIPMAPHVLCKCWYKKERFTKSLKAEGGNTDEEAIHNLWSRFVWQLFVKRGVASATLAICHRVNWFNADSLFTEVGRHERPALLLWGERDALNPPATVASKVEGFFSNAKLMIVPKAGHIALSDQPAKVLPLILFFLRLPPDARMNSVEFPQLAVSQTPKAKTSQVEQNNPDETLNANLEKATAKQDQSHSQTLRAEQMPVPLILGHTEDLEEGGGCLTAL